jgi:hypothetical protein
VSSVIRSSPSLEGATIEIEYRRSELAALERAAAVLER